MPHLIGEESFILTLALPQKRGKSGYYDNLKILGLKRFPGTIAFFFLIGIVAQRHWPIKFIRCLKYIWASWPDKINSWQEPSHKNLLAELKSASSLPVVPGEGFWLFTFSSGCWTKFSNPAPAEATRILPLAWMKIRSCIKRMSSCIITKVTWTLSTYPGQKGGP